MKPIDVVTAARAVNPDAFGKIKDARAARILAVSLREIGRQISAAHEGRIVINGFGTFAVKLVQPKAAGVAKSSVRRVIFRAANPAPGTKKQTR